LCESFHNDVKFRLFSRQSVGGPLDRGPSDASGSAEADRDLAAVLDYHRHQTASARVVEHSVERCCVFLDVYEFERDVPPLVIVTGGLRMRSTVLPEDFNHHSLHPRRSLCDHNPDYQVAHFRFVIFDF
jgi:hypothetical protein